jgi:DNA polymerase V
MYTMGDVALCSTYNEDLLYRLFGVNAELLIDHAWGYEPCLIEDIKAYKPETNSICSGQVLHCPYDFWKARLIVHEMIDLLVLDLVDKQLVTDQIVLDVGYDIENLTDANIRKNYTGAVVMDRYGRQVPKPSHGTANLNRKTSSTKLITEATLALFDKITDKQLLVRRLTVTAAKIIPESQAKKIPQESEQLDIFTDYAAIEQKEAKEKEYLERERKRQETILKIQKRYGKNAMLRGINFEDGATTKDRNSQIGGHKA